MHEKDILFFCQIFGDDITCVYSLMGGLPLRTAGFLNNQINKSKHLQGQMESPSVTKNHHFHNRSGLLEPPISDEKSSFP